MRNEGGQTLIELIVFIVIIGIVLSGVLQGFNTVLKYSNCPVALLTASQLADARMNLILQQRRVNGFASILDPCASGSLDACVELRTFANNNGYVVSSSIPAAVNGVQVVTVTVSGTGSATSVMRFVQ